MNKSETYIFDFKYKALNNRKKKLEQEIGFNFKTKDLRTTFATSLAEQKIDKNLIKKWLGHKSEKTTNSYYIKVLPEFEIDEAKRINSIYTQTYTQKSTKKMQDT